MRAAFCAGAADAAACDLPTARQRNTARTGNSFVCARTPSAEAAAVVRMNRVQASVVASAIATLATALKRASARKLLVLAFHGTRSRSTVDAITKGNFDPKFIGSQTDSGYWGRGFYFSEFPSTSLGYGSNMLLCYLMPGKTFDVKARMDGKPLVDGYQSHRLSADANGYGQELVIDNPKQILPCYILHVG